MLTSIIYSVGVSLLEWSIGMSFTLMWTNSGKTVRIFEEYRVFFNLEQMTIGLLDEDSSEAIWFTNVSQRQLHFTTLQKSASLQYFPCLRVARLFFKR